ncbi:MAG: hypothetical protein QOE82_2789, partial [Thermoanaerobaculia bacterium]|nr:hypothetical protein [Thermoanaerobaculia bacterium]
ANILTGSPLVLTDLNGDGKLDLVGATYVSGQFATPLVTFRGNGDGTFADGIMQPGPYIQSMNDIAIGDFNGDGRTDVIESSYAGQRIATGNGDGSFNAPQFLLGEGRVSIAGDFNGDGKLDYVSTDVVGLSGEVHLGNGNGTFTTGAKYILGGTGRGVALDFDGDGKLDIVTPGNDLATVMRGNGDGTFTVRSYVANSNALVVADFDGDHHLDVLAASYPALVFLHGTSDGSLAGYRKSFLGSNPTGSHTQSDFIGIALADFNGDGKLDAVSRNDGIIVMLNSGDGGFGSPRPLALPPGVNSPLGFATGDVNGDGKADIVVAGTKLWTYLGNGDGTFSTAVSTAVSPNSHVTLKDMNGDGKLDAVLSSADSNGQLLLGNGDGTFAAPSMLPGNPSQIADFDGDGRLDFASNGFGSYRIFRNNGNGTFTAGTNLTNTLGAIAVGDFNNDGKADLVEEMFSSNVRMRLGKGDGTFTDLPPFLVAGIPGGGFAAQAATADFDGDGNLDLAFTNQVMLGKGDGTFRAIVPCVVSRPWTDLAAADIDGNGSADLLLLDYQNSAINTLLTRTAAAGTTPLSLTATSSLSTLHPGESVTVTGTASTSSPFIPSGGIRLDANGVFAGFGAWNDGSASVSWTPLTLGDHTLTASYLGDDVFSASAASVSRTVVKLDTVLDLSVSPSPSQQQQPTSVFYFVGPSQSSTIKPTGTITIRDGETVVLSAPFTSNFQPIRNYRFPSVGTHTLSAEYSGDANFTPATTTYAHVVTKGIAIVLLNGSPASPLTAGQSLTLGVMIGVPTNPNGGTVTFRDFDVEIGTATVAAFAASLTIQPQPGYHSYSATYNGNAIVDPAKSINLDYEVKAVPCAPAANCARKHAAR